MTPGGGGGGEKIGRTSAAIWMDVTRKRATWPLFRQSRRRPGWRGATSDGGPAEDAGAR